MRDVKKQMYKLAVMNRCIFACYGGNRYGFGACKKTGFCKHKKVI
jgi:hypothetical protein